MNTSKVWYITGPSQGLGLTLVKKLLAAGYRVAATSRNAQMLKNAVGLVDSERWLPLSVDPGNGDCIEESVRQTVEAFGRIDVVVNNAGHGMAGKLEETEDQKIRDIIDVNLVAAIAVVKAVLPVLRKQGEGYIINIGGVAGFVGAPGWPVYSATKAALAAFSEVLALDVAESGIRVTYLAMNGRQTGDPEKAAEIFVALAQRADPPLHLFLGADAYSRASKKLAEMSAELEKWKELTIGADLDAPLGSLADFSS
ncbi:SDR family NAD(P)-dependent oxidoreductase [Puia sp. P3]|uniref:SDR family NAD(P)-dependent oxidoreductase n=1 Tax=Puia sp. P3 TaxID=3423952 RepID=UPI003D67BEE7